MFTDSGVDPLEDAKKPALPEMIAGQPWYRFVDPAIDQNQLLFVTDILNDDYKFLEALLSGDVHTECETEKEADMDDKCQGSASEGEPILATP